MKKRKPFFIFDCYQTLVKKQGLSQNLKDFAKIHFNKEVSEQTTENAHRTLYERKKFIHPQFKDEAERLHYFTAYNQELLKEIGISATEKDARLLYRKLSTLTYALYADVISTLTYCKKENITMGMIANWTETLDDVLEDLGIKHYFDFIYSSHNLGVSKPDPVIFLRALERENIMPSSHIYYIGDDYDLDIVPAQKAGLTPVLLKRTGGNTTEHCRVINSLNELEKLTICR